MEQRVRSILKLLQSVIHLPLCKLLKIGTETREWS